MLGKTASTDAETAANFRDNLTKIINEGSYMKKNRFSIWTKWPPIGRRWHLGFSQREVNARLQYFK